ncbi:hypothetical protein VNO77_29828 [Canavalia gladiata]|uniref:Uncharacterized protein n=1 Tax=Canavalia gladiata TaxID=3824 RepID=A0AAN9KMV1_CANGL
MPQSLCNIPTRANTQTTFQKSKDFTFSATPTKESMHKSTTLNTNATKDMAGFPPVEIGTRGTVASLIMQEIEYFSRIGSYSQDRSQKVGSSNISTSSRTTIVSTIEESTKKKRGSSSKLLPSMCSMVDVSDNGRPNGTSAFSYRNLKSDTKKFQGFYPLYFYRFHCYWLQLLIFLVVVFLRLYYHKELKQEMFEVYFLKIPVCVVQKRCDPIPLSLRN